MSDKFGTLAYFSLIDSALPCISLFTMEPSMNHPVDACELLPPVTETSERLPVGGLLALASAGFITLLTEAMPAGLLPQMSQGLEVSPPLIGQLVTLYALGSLLAAIPLVTLTQSWRRRPLLLIAIGGFAIVNSITALSSDYSLTLVARFCAGVFAGLLWALLPATPAAWWRLTCRDGRSPWPCSVRLSRCPSVFRRGPCSATWWVGA